MSAPRRFFAVGLILLLGAVAVLGYRAWPVESPVQTWCNDRGAQWGIQVSVGRATWIPWEDLEMRDLKIRVPQGGVIHFVRVRIHPRFSSLLKGALITQWKIGEIRIDPASWRIRKPIAQESFRQGRLPLKDLL